MKLFRIFAKSKAGIFDSLSSAEKKKIIEKALNTANKEQFEVVKAYRESCQARN